MKKQIFFFAVFLLILPSVHAQTTQETDLYWYVKGEQLHFFKQTDVFAFRLKSRSPYQNTFRPDVVDTVIFRTAGSTYNLLLFAPESSATDREAVINAIKSNPDFEREHNSITWKPELPHNKGQWVIALDKLLILYKLGTSEAQIDGFVKDRDLILYGAPPDLHSFFVYYMGDLEGERDPIDLAKDIFLNESIVRECHPARSEIINH